VQPGDTLQSIAARHNTTVAALSAANRLTDQDDIQPGTQLIVPCGTTTPPQAGQSGYPLCEDGNVRYVVQEGDTLYSISTRYGTSVAVIAAANGIDDPAYIFVGQTITIPCEL
jgi:LysM repeat protein